MNLSSLKAALRDELFVSGRVWNEDVSLVADTVSLNVDLSDSDLLEYTRFSLQIAREFETVSTGLLQEGGTLGTPVSYITKWVETFMYMPCHSNLRIL